MLAHSLEYRPGNRRDRPHAAGSDIQTLDDAHVLAPSSVLDNSHAFLPLGIARNARSRWLVSIVTLGRSETPPAPGVVPAHKPEVRVIVLVGSKPCSSKQVGTHSKNFSNCASTACLNSISHPVLIQRLGGMRRFRLFRFDEFAPEVSQHWACVSPVLAVIGHKPRNRRRAVHPALPA